jgi:uncharacterized protein YozE (UPF0346 family)
MTKEISFYDWLMKQVRQGDIISDLAKDVKSDSKFPKTEKDPSILQKFPKNKF